MQDTTVEIFDEDKKVKMKRKFLPNFSWCDFLKLKFHTMNKQTIDYYRHFLVQVPTPAVEKINESTFTNYAKGWAHMGFLPILTKIDEHTYHVKLYLNDSVINDREQLCMFTATYFRERFCQLSTQAKSNQIVVYAQTWLTPKQIASATSLNDLEQSLLSILPDETLF